MSVGVKEGFLSLISLGRSLIQHYPFFGEKLRASLRVLVGEDVESRVDIGMAKDGSGVGGEQFPSPSFRRVHALIHVCSCPLRTWRI